MNLLNHTLPPASVDKLRLSNLEIELDDAHVKLKHAEIWKEASEIGVGWDLGMHAHQNSMKNIEKVNGDDLITIEAIVLDPVVNQINHLKELFQGIEQGEDYDEEPHTFRFPSVLSRVC